jgi:hypothetical protein
LMPVQWLKDSARSIVPHSSSRGFKRQEYCSFYQPFQRSIQSLISDERKVE